MRLVRKHRFGDYESCELGWSLVGAPFMTVRFYRIGDLLIDSGPSRMQREALAFAGEKPPSQILLTHHHEDHSGNAAAISHRFGARVLGHPLCAEALRQAFPVRPYQHWVWGAPHAVAVQPLPEVVEGDSARLLPVHTPGHSRDLVVFLDRARGVLLSGDLYLGDRIKYFRSGESLAEQIVSLRKVLTLDFDVLLCAHHPRPQGGKQHLAAKLQFLEDFLGEVRTLREHGLSDRAILHALRHREVWGVVAFTLGNVGFAHMVRAALRALASQTAGVDS